MPAKMNGKKNQVQKRRNVKASPQLPLCFRPIPNMRLNLIFKQEVSVVESAAGLGATKWYRMTGAFDPDQTAGGPSALGFNQYASLFTSYRVMKMRFHAEGTVGSGGSPGGAAFGVVTLTPNPRSVTLPADAALWGGEPGAVTKTCMIQAVGGKNMFTIDKTFLPWEVLKVTKSQYINEADYASLVTTTPVKEPYLAFSVNGVLTSLILNMTAIVTISYEVEFFEPNLLV